MTVLLHCGQEWNLLMEEIFVGWLLVWKKLSLLGCIRTRIMIRFGLSDCFVWHCCYSLEYGYLNILLDFLQNMWKRTCSRHCSPHLKTDCSQAIRCHHCKSFFHFHLLSSCTHNFIRLKFSVSMVRSCIIIAGLGLWSLLLCLSGFALRLS